MASFAYLFSLPLPHFLSHFPDPSALVFLTRLCCGIQRFRAARSSLGWPQYIPSPLPLTSSSHFPHGIQYDGRTPPAMHAAPPSMAVGSECPVANAADFAPPPYVKEEPNSKPVYAPVRVPVFCASTLSHSFPLSLSRPRAFGPTAASFFCTFVSLLRLYIDAHSPPPPPSISSPYSPVRPFSFASSRSG
ncbi:hypothetical protein MSAN_01590100 [Mycena sanguinolenta]|uniref:Uncharacterized protein n=1 Tax=Mycena sanguinolenta TaxID=230812 RepID=A0A8H6Y426_9AGAR|nr:hypothetical protein MSAN_01590100 [Mycena sanguinolenta]